LTVSAPMNFPNSAGVLRTTSPPCDKEAQNIGISHNPRNRQDFPVNCAAMAVTRKTPLIVAGVIVALLAAYFGYVAYDKRKLARTVIALVADTGARLRAAIMVEADADAPDATAAQAKLAEHAATAERHLATLRALDAAPVRALADAADEYLNTSVEILRRRAASHSHRQQLALSAQALREHMQKDNRSGPWVTNAIRAKERMDKDYRDYRLAAEALAQLLGGYSISRRRMAAHVDPALLPDDGAAEAARARTLAEVKRTGTEVEKAGRLDAYR
jgi:hypothetical protein